MGAWGEGTFENDSVRDWLAELDDAGQVKEALDALAGAQPGLVSRPPASPHRFPLPPGRW